MESRLRQIAPEVGMLAARRTGNMALDMAIAVSIPLLMEACTEGWRRARPLLWELVCQTFSLQRRKNRFYRCIEFERQSIVQQFNPDEELPSDGKRNNILQRAILLYIAQMNTQYASARVMLSATKELGAPVHVVDPLSRRMKTVYGGTAEQLKGYIIGVAPPENEWVDVGDGILFKSCQITRTIVEGVDPHGGNNQTHVVKQEFVCVKPDGAARIQAFIDRAFAWYLRFMESTEDQSRYLFDLQSPAPEPVSMVNPVMPFSQVQPGIPCGQKNRCVSRGGKSYRYVGEVGHPWRLSV